MKKIILTGIFTSLVLSLLLSGCVHKYSFDIQFQNKSLAEKIQIAKMKHELELERQKNEEERDIRRWERKEKSRREEIAEALRNREASEARADARDQAKFIQKTNVQKERDEAKEKSDRENKFNEVRTKAMQKSFTSPADFQQWLDNPKEAESRMEEYNAAGFLKKMLGGKDMRNRLKPKREPGKRAPIKTFGTFK
jgi:hypothetical protein